MTLNEDYVSFETAKLMKEKGFEGENRDWYNMEGFIEEIGVDDGIDPTAHEDIFNNIIPAPTLQMAMKWLREIHKLEVRSTYDYDKDTWWGRINPMFDETDENSDIFQKALRFDYPGKSYEEVCEVIIKYCLENLI